MDPIIIIALTFAGLGAGFATMLCLTIPKLRRMGKARILLIDPDGRTIEDVWAKVEQGAVRTKNRTLLLEGVAKYGGMTPTWLVNLATGWNYTAPTRAQTLDADLKLAVLEPSNPESYHRAIFRHRWDETFRAGEEPDKWGWVPLVAILGFILLIAIVGIVGWVAFHLPAGAAPGAK